MKCYIVFLRPFDSGERKNDKATKCEKDSIKAGIAGMGWRADELWKSGINYIYDKSVPYNNPNEKQKSDNKLKRSWKTAVNMYAEMEAGDYVLTRTIGGICYVGKVMSKAYHEKGKYAFESFDEYSWVVDVKWKKIGEFIDIPNGLRGLMSGRIGTVKRVVEDVHKELIEFLFTGKTDRIKLTKTNFVDALDPLDLEDLVALFITKKNPSFMLLPSTCKVNEPKYEFKFVDTNNSGEQITCQVKNKKDVQAHKYYSESFKNIYLFSGIEKYGNLSGKPENIDIIEKKDLYDILKENYEKGGFMKEQLGDHFIFE